VSAREGRFETSFCALLEKLNKKSAGEERWGLVLEIAVDG